MKAALMATAPQSGRCSVNGRNESYGAIAVAAGACGQAEARLSAGRTASAHTE
jgi:hypothetical protein